MSLQDFQAVTVTHVDNAGISRLKIIPASRIPSITQSGATVSFNVAALLAVDDVPVSPPGVDAAIGDLRLFPDVEQLAMIDPKLGLGWAPADIRTLDGAEFEGCARTLLQRAAREASDAGITFTMGAELEFGLLNESDASPAHSGPGYGVRPFVELEQFHLELLEDLAVAGVRVEQLHPEYGPGQMELSFSPGEPLHVIDELMLARFVVLRTARRFGFNASFAPVAFAGGVGNGLHLHVSARQNGKNVFADPKRELGISVVGEQMIAGVLDGIRRGVALLAGSTVSFQRLRPGNWAGGYICWGDGNREAAIRLMRGFAGAEDRQSNIEVKCVDGSSNPYLAAAWILFSALRGVHSEEPAPLPIAVDPAVLSAAERRAADVTDFPESLGEALDLLEGDDLVRECLGSVLLESYVAVRRRDWERWGDLPEEEVVEGTRYRS